MFLIAFAFESVLRVSRNLF